MENIMETMVLNEDELTELTLCGLKIFSAITYDGVYRVNVMADEKLNQKSLCLFTTHINPTIESYLEAFSNLHESMVEKVKDYYKKLIPDRDDLKSILYLTIMKLYNKDYYICNRHLLFKSFVNELNMSIRKCKKIPDVISFDDIVQIDNTENLSLADILSEPDESRDTEFWDDKFNELKQVIIEDIGDFGYRLLLLTLSSKTVDKATSNRLEKYRKQMGSRFIPRPNGRRNKK